MHVTEKDGVRGFYVVVYSNPEDKEIFNSNEFFRFRDMKYLLWGDNDTFWIYSGDLGVFYWERTDNSWDKKNYSENKDIIKVPDVLKLLRPSKFK